MVATVVAQEHRVSPRELFFDLVIVFAFTQVATLMADDPSFRRESVAACSCWPRSGGHGQPTPG